MFENRIRFALQVTGMLVVLPHLAAATPPTPPWRALERTAEVDGVEAVRTEFQQTVDQLLGRLEAQPERLTTQSLPGRLLEVGTVIEYLSAWVQAEGRAIHVDAQGLANFDGVVWQPIMDRAARAVAVRGRLSAASGVLSRRLSREERGKLRWAFDGLRASTRNQDILGMRVALLAVVAQQPQHLDSVLECFDGHVGSFVTAAALATHDHDFDQVYRTTRSPAVRRSPQAAMQPQARVLALAAARDYFDALADGDTQKLSSLFTDAEVAAAALRRMRRTRITAIDLSAAEFRVHPTGPEDLRVDLDGPVTVTLAGGEQRSYRGHQSLHMRVVQGKPRIIRVGGPQ